MIDFPYSKSPQVMEAPPVDEFSLDGEWYILVPEPTPAPVGCQQSMQAHASCLSIRPHASQLLGTVLELILR